MFTNNLIRLMSKLYLQFRHERIWGNRQIDLFPFLSVCLSIYSLSWNTGFNFWFWVKFSSGCVCWQTTTIHSYSSGNWVHCELKNLVYSEYIILVWPSLTLECLNLLIFPTTLLRTTFSIFSLMHRVGKRTVKCLAGVSKNQKFNNPLKMGMV